MKRLFFLSCLLTLVFFTVKIPQSYSDLTTTECNDIPKVAITNATFDVRSKRVMVNISWPQGYSRSDTALLVYDDESTVVLGTGVNTAQNDYTLTFTGEVSNYRGTVRLQVQNCIVSSQDKYIEISESAIAPTSTPTPIPTSSINPSDGSPQPGLKVGEACDPNNNLCAGSEPCKSYKENPPTCGGLVYVDDSPNTTIMPVKSPCIDNICETAIGAIDTTSPSTLVRDALEKVIAVASIIGFLMLLYSGYLILLSRGDSEKITQGRDILTSTITGIIFLILSIGILEIIGVDILHIPGFRR
jgi:hypothetical protein